ncbi:MAG: hypothetical protein IK999_14155 [Ruminococcus sp.]|nr:hypothetical protein [Ruminococcus sp.]
MQSKIKDLKMEKSRYSEKIYELQDNIRVKYPTQIQMLETNTEKSRKDLETATTGNAILTIGGKSYDMTDPDCKKAGAEALKSALNDPKNTSEAVSHEVRIGEYRGFKLSMLFDDLTKAWKGCLEGNKPHYLDWNIHTDVGNITRMDNCISHIGKEVGKSAEKLETLKAELVQMEQDVNKPFAKSDELRAAETELDEVHIELTMFTLTDDSMNKEIFERLVDIFEPILTGDKTYQKYTAEGFEPLCVEMEGHILTIAHSYVQNGDLMWDPRIDFKIDYENKKATPVSYEMSSLGVYEEYDIKNLTPEIAEKLNELLDYTDTWLDNIEAKGYRPIGENEIEYSRKAVTAR